MHANVSSYLAVLKELCEAVRRYPIDEAMRAALAAAPCLIGYRHGGKQWVAVRASECFIGDNQRFVDLFEPLVAPEDATLKELYCFLGVRPLSEAVEIEARPVGGKAPTPSKLSEQVAAIISERSCLLLHDIDAPDCPLRTHLREGMHDVVRSGRVRVGEVGAISCTLRFAGRQLEQQNARACVMHEPAADGGEELIVAISCTTACAEVRRDPAEMRELLEAVGDALASGS